MSEEIMQRILRLYPAGADHVAEILEWFPAMRLEPGAQEKLARRLNVFHVEDVTKACERLVDLHDKPTTRQILAVVRPIDEARKKRAQEQAEPEKKARRYTAEEVRVRSMASRCVFFRMKISAHRNREVLRDQLDRAPTRAELDKASMAAVNEWTNEQAGRAFNEYLQLPEDLLGGEYERLKRSVTAIDREHPLNVTSFDRPLEMRG